MNADQQYWDAVRTGERDEEPWPPLPTPESIYRGKCPDGTRCLHGCHHSDKPYCDVMRSRLNSTAGVLPTDGGQKK